MNEEARPTEGLLPCSEEQAREILEALEIDRVAKRLIRSAHAALEGGTDAEV